MMTVQDASPLGKEQTGMRRRIMAHLKGPLPCWKVCPGQFLTDAGVAQGLLLCPATVLGPLKD